MPSKFARPPISTRCDGLIIPGGESTTMLKLLDIEESDRAAAASSASTSRSSAPAPGRFCWRAKSRIPRSRASGLMDHRRRAQRLRPPDRQPHRAAFPCRRAQTWKRSSSARPSSAASAPATTVLAQYNGDPVWVEQGRHMVTTFHPELTARFARPPPLSGKAIR